MTAIAPMLAPPPLSPDEQAAIDRANEIAARLDLSRVLHLSVTVRAPTWRQILFSGRPVKFDMPRPPSESLAILEKADPEGPSASLLRSLQREMPKPSNQRTIAASKPLPPPKDAMNAWLRRVFLVTAGPEALRLLVASGYLTPDDVDIMEQAYPAGLDEERKGSVEGAMAITSAAQRNGQEPDVPGWLNDQLITLMDEHRPVEFFASLYEPDQQAPQGPSAGSGQSIIAGQNAPIVSNIGGAQ